MNEPLSPFIRPSSATRWIVCAGSIRLCESLPPDPPPTPGEAALRGILGHRLIELTLRLDLPLAVLADRLGIDDVELVAAASDIVERIMPMLTPESTVRIENRLDILDGAISGTADLVIVDGETATLVDYKFGVMPVEVRDPQFTLYAAGVLEHFLQVERITITVAQPFAPHVDGPWRSRLLDRAGIRPELAEIEQAIQRTQQPDAPLVAGGHCRFCPARGVCPALDAFAITAARDAFSDATDLAPETALARRLDMVPALDAWAESQSEIAVARLREGWKLPGYALGRIRGSRRWTADQDAILAFLVDELGLDLDQVAPRRLVTPAAAEAMLRLIGHPTTDLTGLWSRFEGTPKVVQASDPSTAAEPVEWGPSSFVEDF